MGVESDGQSVPKTFVMERGKVGSVLNQLVLDLRQVMEPYTASKLKVSVSYAFMGGFCMEM